MDKVKFNNSFHKKYWISFCSQTLFLDRYEREKQRIVDNSHSVRKLINIKSNQLLSIDELIKTRFIGKEVVA